MPKYEMSAEQYRGQGSEADWRKTVKDMAAHYGWVVLFELPDKGYETLVRAANESGNGSLIPALRAIRGQPDLLLGCPEYGETIAVELKKPGQKPKPHQQERLDLYEDCGISAFVWETGDPQADDVLGTCSDE